MNILMEISANAPPRVLSMLKLLAAIASRLAQTLQAELLRSEQLSNRHLCLPERELAQCLVA